MRKQTTFLQFVSDAFIPEKIANILYDTVFFKVGPTDVNGWTIIHFLNGLIIAYFTNKNILYGIGLHTIWEIFQFIAGDNKVDFETFIDITIDTLAFLGGWRIGIYSRTSFSSE